jgi:hypothetical protein
MSTVEIYSIAWLGLMVIGILNGMLRVTGYQKYMPEIRAHQLSCFTGICFIGLAVFSLNRAWPIDSSRQAFLIGLIWLVLTIVFEFGFGRFIMRHPWKKLVYDYRIDKGRLWLVVLTWVFSAPLFMHRYF